MRKKIQIPAKKTMGKGAVICCLVSKLHPSYLFNSKFKTLDKHKRLENPTVGHQEEIETGKKKKKLMIVLRHKDYKDEDGEYQVIYAALRFCQISQEGDPDLFFEEQTINRSIVRRCTRRNAISRGGYEDCGFNTICCSFT